MLQSPCLQQQAHFVGSAFASPAVVVGFRATAACDPLQESPWRSASAGGDPEASAQRRARSLLSDLLQAEDADTLMAVAAAYDDDEDEEDDDDDLNDEDLDLLDALDAAWGSPTSSSALSSGTAATGRSAASSSTRPIAIPAASYFKDQAQRAHLEKLTKKRQVGRAAHSC
jgi:hypothetical protein